MEIQEENFGNLSQDSLDDIKDLFKVLFVEEMNKNLKSMNDKSDEIKTQIKQISKQETDNFNMLDDKLNGLEARISCLGESDDWDETTLVSFLNSFAVQIATVKEDIINKLKTIDDVSENYSQINYELRQIHETIAILGILQEDIKIIEKQYETGGIIDDLFSICNNIENEIQNGNLCTSLIREAISGLNQKHERIEKDIIEFNLQVASYESKVNGYVNEVNDFKDNLEHAILNLGDYTKKKFLYLNMGIGFSVILNIVMILIILFK